MDRSQFEWYSLGLYVMPFLYQIIKGETDEDLSNKKTFKILDRCQFKWHFWILCYTNFEHVFCVH